MRRAIALLLAFAAAAPAPAAEIAAAPPHDLAVTIYRAPGRGSGSINLEYLGGFALVTETRDVAIPAGTSRLRFEGVADGIEPASAIVTGLPSGVIEKNRDAHLLSPSALIAAALGKPVTLVRTNAKTGKTVRTTGTIRSDAGGGVVFETADGIEALRCSGLAETFTFDAADTGLSARPTLSVLTRSDRPITATVTLSYLASGFDWAADYVATLSPDGKTIDLGAWVTLANGNGTGFPESRTQIVAGRLNKLSGDVEPIAMGEPIIAQCWPRGSTSDTPMPYPPPPPPPPPPAAPMMMEMAAPMAAMRADSIVVTARKVEQEQLGDLKLYRVPDRTTVASRQAKQVRLLDRKAIPFTRIYGADLGANQDRDFSPALVLLRSRNDAAHHLGLPLPSGRVAVFEEARGRPMLAGEAGLKDLAIDEEIELKLGGSPDVQVRQVHETEKVDAAHAKLIPLLPGILLARSAEVDDASRVEISNARPFPIAFELRLGLGDDSRVVRADHPMAMKNGRPIFRLTIPANASITLRYQTETQ